MSCLGVGLKLLPEDPGLVGLGPESVLLKISFLQHLSKAGVTLTAPRPSVPFICFSWRLLALCAIVRVSCGEMSEKVNGAVGSPMINISVI